jgi:hypothetical protein
MYAQTEIERQCRESIEVARLKWLVPLAGDDDEIVHLGYSRKELLVAFTPVCDQANWKKPIAGEIDLADVQVTVAAIAFYTGSLASVQLLNTGRCRISAAGYYLTCGP